MIEDYAQSFTLFSGFISEIRLVPEQKSKDIARRNWQTQIAMGENHRAVEKPPPLSISGEL